MSKRKHTFGLKIYPQIDHEVHEYFNEMGRKFIDEIHPLLKSIPKESISEGEAEIIERSDGSRATMTFDEVEFRAALDNNASIHGKFDEIVSFVYEIANEMGGRIEKNVLTTVYKSAEESGNVYHSEELDVNIICEILEKANLTFNDEGVMDQQFVIHPYMADKFKKIASDTRIQAIIERKRREYFAKKDN